jgi:hypothetical protein
MYTKKMIFALVLGIFLFVARPFSAAQDANAEPKTTSRQSTPGPLVGYRLDFSINELEDGKKINTRRYSMNLIDGVGGGQSLKIGTRVPVQSEQGKFEYLDTGTSITAHLIFFEKPLGLDVNAEISSFPASNEGRASGTPPLIRQLRIEGSTVVILDKPMIIGSVDDPDSKRSFQLEVIVTKLQ